MQFTNARVMDMSTGETGLGVHGHLMSRTTLVEFDNGSKRWVNNENLMFEK